MVNLKNCDIKRFEEIVSQKKVIIFGAGRFLEKIMKRSPIIEEKIELIIDNNCAGKELKFKNKEIIVNNIDIVKHIHLNNVLLLISSAKYYSEMIDQLDKLSYFNNIDCYVWIFMVYCIPKSKNFFKSTVYQKYKTEGKKIPTIIHTFWFSGDKKPKLQEECLNSWKRICPNYNIVEWNMSNYDVHKHPFMEQAYRMKKWAFISDYARLDVLYKYGGFYFDLDVEIIQNITPLEYLNSFFAFDCNGVIDLGSGVGVKKENYIIKKLLDSYNNCNFILNENMIDDRPQPIRLAKKFEEIGLKLNGQLQQVQDTIFFPTDYFSPIDFLFYENQKNSNTISIHHYDDGWFNTNQESEKIKRRKEARSYLTRINKNGV